MRDLYGVPLPYSKLDDEIELLFGPTVVRRKLLKEGTESLDPVRPWDGVLWVCVSHAGSLLCWWCLAVSLQICGHQESAGRLLMKAEHTDRWWKQHGRRRRWRSA
jgi:hypothetical protein